MILICVTLLIANVINIGADLSGMADAAKIWTGVDSHIYIVLFGVGIGWGMIRFHYAQIANVLKWLALFLFAYIITAFLVKPDWLHILKVAAIPSIPKGKAVWSMIVAILGTTISPYLFFWQAAEEVEEEKSKGRRTLAQRQGATKQEINDRALDISVGTFFSNLVMFFIILTTALTLHAHGLTHITSSKQAAEALLPLAGNLATTLYTLGIVGVGLLAIPTLAGSAAYAFAEIFHWRGSLDAKFKAAHPFYVIIILSLLCGVGIDFIGIDPISAMYWSAVLNGLLAPFLLIGVLIIARDKKIMRGQPSSLAAQAVAALTTLLMFGAMIGMFL